MGRDRDNVRVTMVPHVQIPREVPTDGQHNAILQMLRVLKNDEYQSSKKNQPVQ